MKKFDFRENVWTEKILQLFYGPYEELSKTSIQILKKFLIKRILIEEIMQEFCGSCEEFSRTSVK